METSVLVQAIEEVQELMKYKEKREGLPPCLRDGLRKVESEIFSLHSFTEKYTDHVFTLDEIRGIIPVWEYSQKFLNIEYIQFLMEHNPDIILLNISGLRELINNLDGNTSDHHDPRSSVLRDKSVLRFVLKVNDIELSPLPA